MRELDEAAGRSSAGMNAFYRSMNDVARANAVVRESFAAQERKKIDDARKDGNVWKSKDLSGVVAFVVARPGVSVAPADLDRLCLDNIARFKRPKDYKFIDALPKNNYGKILKTELRSKL